LAAQTYPNLESLVVNDGGVPVGGVVAEFPFARVINQPENAGAPRAVEFGWREIRGEYIGLLPDDDWLYPDHIERLMNAMFRTGAMVAHGAGLLRYVERSENGEAQTSGFNATTFCQSMIGSDALVSATVGGHQMLVHRSVYDTVGGYRLDSEISDNEMHIRIAQRYFYAYVDHVTAEFRDHSGGTGRQCDFPAALRHIYTEVHPVKDRPYIDRMREATIENVARRPAGQPPFPPSLYIRR
jgi:glycosyltransferase involved in cell wall biosynthesis